MPGSSPAGAPALIDSAGLARGAVRSLGGRPNVLRRLLDSPWTYFGLAGVLFVLLLYTQFEIRVPPRSSGTPDDIRKLAERTDTNLVFVVIDTLRADRVHSYGYQRETSPVMDYLANTGIRFDRVVSQSSWTKASMASLWTGSWPARHGITRWNHSIPDEAVLPPEILQKAGFYTAGVWRNGWVAPNFGFNQGFNTYVKPQPLAGPERFQRRTPSASPLIGTDEDLTMASIEFLNAYGHKRFFLYLHLMDVHQYAYDEASARFGTSYSDVYDNAIHWVDRNIGQLLKELQERDLMRKTILVITSDHGEGFREHGLEGHAKTLYREVSEVPFIIALPFELSPGIVVPDLVANVDVWPTLLDLLGLPALPDTDGRSLVPLIEAAAKGQPSGFDRPAFAEIDRTWGRPTGGSDPLVSITKGPIRAMQASAPEKTGEVEYYDHGSDPWETKNLASNAGKLPDDIAGELERYRALPPVWGAPKEVELDEMELHQLRALGYVVR
jgi:arylsulfatase A-like enzyme